MAATAMVAAAAMAVTSEAVTAAQAQELAHVAGSGNASVIDTATPTVGPHGAAVVRVEVTPTSTPTSTATPTAKPTVTPTPRRSKTQNNNNNNNA
ncbi:hypothetical protein [Streptosporangium roseum]|uniref:hypothetical protein n=1 Tax=Streptosporangium roseum TaxID=2001 RepID=UPI0009D6E845|nr:hypothetical protein [Streptosporangium roseum]